MNALSRRECAIFACVADTLLAPASPLPPVGRTDAVRAFDAWLARAPRLNRVGLRAVLLALEVAPRLSGDRGRWRTLDRTGRMAVLRRIERAGGRPLVEVLRAAAAMSYYGDPQVAGLLGYEPGSIAAGAGGAEDAPAGGVPAARRVGGQAGARSGAARRAGRVSATAVTGGVVDGTRLDRNRQIRVDVCVVGSGAGGAPVACALARAGARVAVVEEGGRFTQDDLTARPRDMTALLYRDAGQTATVGSPPILLPLGRAVGGTTLVNSGTCFRAPEHVLDRWRTDLGLDGLDLHTHYGQVERDLGVSRVTDDIAGRNALIAKRGAEALGWSGRFLDRNARGCRGSGVCAFGCPTGAKQHTGATYMAWAQDAGATTYTDTRVTSVLLRGRRARGVEARTAGGGRLTVHAGTVVVAAGTLHTPLLLARSGIAHPQLGRNLSIHPATAAWALMDEEVDMARGVPQAYCVDEFVGEGLMFEGVAGPPDYLAMAVPYSGDRHRQLMLRYRHVAQLGLMVADTSRGCVLTSALARRAGRPIVRYDLNRHDTATVHRGIVRLARLLFAAGGRTVFVPVGGRPELSGPGALRDLERHPLRAGDLKLMAFHPLGTARAAARPDQGVLDGDLQVHEVGNLYVADGSAVPTALGVNPQMTIMALATRLGAHLACPS